jgi:hypothetical protein
MKKHLSRYLTNGNPYVILLLLFVPTFFIRYFLANAQVITSDGILYLEIAKGISLGNFQSISNYGFFNLY